MPSVSLSSIATAVNGGPGYVLLWLSNQKGPPKPWKGQSMSTETEPNVKASWKTERCADALQKQQALTNGAAKPELRPATVEKKPDPAPRRLGLADLRAAAKARQAVA